MPACRDGSLLLLPLLLVLVAALLAPACDSSADRRATAASADPEGPRPAPAATWGGKSGKVLAVDGFTDRTLTFDCCMGNPSKATISARNWDEGTRFTVGDQTWTQARRGDERTPITLTSRLGKLSLAGYAASLRTPAPAVPLDLGLAIEIQLPGPWQPIRTTAPAVELRHQQATLILAAVVDGPIVFAGEPTKATPDTALILYQHRPMANPLHGPGTRLEDVDWVVIPRWHDTGKVKKCGGYSQTSGVRGNIVVSFALHDVELTVHDRRTGKVLGTRTFPPDPTCPGIASSTAEGLGASNQVMVAWLAAQLKQGRIQ